MDINQAVAENEEEKKTSQDSSPQSEETTIESQTPQEEVKSPEQPAEVQDESSGVEMTEEQRKAFQDMRLENKRLKEEMEARGKAESAFDHFRPQSTGPVNINNFVNETGEVDWNRYNQAVTSQAQTVAAQTVQETLDEQRARDKYPEVFADPDLEEAIAGQWFASKMKGANVTVESLAQKFSKKLGNAVTKAEKEGAKKALTELTPKEQASLSAQGQSSSGMKNQLSQDEESFLEQKTREGDEEARAKLFSKVSWKQ